MIRGAAEGGADERTAFAARYLPVVRSYIAARWRSSPLAQDVDDAVHEVFVECFREGGALARVAPERPGGFRAFLYGVARNVALRFESRQARHREQQPSPSFSPDQLANGDDALSQVFDRAWARAIMREAAVRQAQWASTAGDDAVRRVELLRLRFYEDLPIREIAERWQADPAQVHRWYARAREEFKQALLEVIAFHHPDAPGVAESECARLLSMLA